MKLKEPALWAMLSLLLAVSYMAKALAFEAISLVSIVGAGIFIALIMTQKSSNGMRILSVLGMLVFIYAHKVYL